MILRKLYPEGSDSLSNSSWMSLGAVRKTSKTTAVTKRRRRRNHEMLGYSPASCWSKGDWYSAKHSRTYEWSSKSLIIRTTYDRGPWTHTTHTNTHTTHATNWQTHIHTMMLAVGGSFSVALVEWGRRAVVSIPAHTNKTHTHIHYSSDILGHTTVVVGMQVNVLLYQHTHTHTHTHTHMHTYLRHLC